LNLPHCHSCRSARAWVHHWEQLQATDRCSLRVPTQARAAARSKAGIRVSAPVLGLSLTARAELEKDRIVVSEVYPLVTATNFAKNRMGNPVGVGPSTHYVDGDNPEFVAGLVLQDIEEG
jgi:hypothetical protein